MLGGGVTEEEIGVHLVRRSPLSMFSQYEGRTWRKREPALGTRMDSRFRGSDRTDEGQ